MLTLVFDLDGTLFDGTPSCYEDPASILRDARPHAFACELVRRAHAAGHKISYLTGRAEVVRSATLLQLAHAGLPPGPLVMQPSWDGYPTMCLRKARGLRTLRADVHIGDHAEDANASAIAGVPFLHADHWRQGSVPLNLQHILPTRDPHASLSGVPARG